MGRQSLALAGRNLKKANVRNASALKSDIEEIPHEDRSVDVIISNDELSEYNGSTRPHLLARPLAQAG